MTQSLDRPPITELSQRLTVSWPLSAATKGASLRARVKAGDLYAVAAACWNVDQQLGRDKAAKRVEGPHLIQKSDRAPRRQALYTPDARHGAPGRLPEVSARRQFPRSAGVPISPQMPGPFWSRSPMASQTSRTGSLVRRFS